MSESMDGIISVLSQLLAHSQCLPNFGVSHDQVNPTAFFPVMIVNFASRQSTTSQEVLKTK
jgi:hypothetical protein